jgi:hypothetical protein
MKSLFMIRQAGMCLTLIAWLIASGCRQEPTADDPRSIQVVVQVHPAPPRVGPAIATVILSDAGGNRIRDAAIQVEGDMNHAGMRPEFGTGREVEPGRYEAPLQFTMGGDWFLLVDAYLADGRKLRKKVDLPAVRRR